MTLALNREQPPLVINRFGNLLTTKVALEQQGRLHRREPLAKIIGKNGLRETTARDLLQAPIAETEAAPAVEPVVFTGSDSKVCVRALEKLARARVDSHHRANARLMLTDMGLEDVANRAARVSELKNKWLPEWVTIDEPKQPAAEGSVPINPDLEHLEPLTQDQMDAYEDLIARWEAKPVTPPEERDAALADYPTGVVPIVPSPRQSEDVAHAA
ncbi:MAG: hypothetical protein JWM37_169 [Candidatus Saccharibacteria bacterium]|nr:hypothetical protein [Candidatus Saccharibacteria bacterium]